MLHSNALFARLMCATAMLWVSAGTARAADVQDIQLLTPVDDAYVVTYGGGEGCNTYFKFDIALLHTIPEWRIVDSVKLMIQTRNIVGWDGDMNLWNVHNQTWTETDSNAVLWSSPTSDSIHQSHFGIVGSTYSVNLMGIFNTDYSLYHQYCTIKLKDPDDITSAPALGVPVNSSDTLMIGDRSSPTGPRLVAWPREAGPNYTPQLIVYYHQIPTGMAWASVASRSGALETKSLLSTVFVRFQVEVQQPGALILQVFDVGGRAVWSSRVDAPTVGRNVINWNASAETAQCSYLVITRQGDRRTACRLQLVR
jgi:hypothetical protein